MRIAEMKRETNETKIQVEVNLDGSGKTNIDTGMPFFDHMLDQLGRHSGFDIYVHAEGDLEIDFHHTVEDIGIVLGQAIAEAIGDKKGLVRFASNATPLDEALVQVALDVSGRSFLAYDLDLQSPTASFDFQLLEEFWRALTSSAHITLHIRKLAGRNGHHIAEASFKGVALALKAATRVSGDAIPSTKGLL